MSVNFRGEELFAKKSLIPCQTLANPYLFSAGGLTSCHTIPAKVALHFKPGKEMGDRVNAARDKCSITE
jgi:hypothetical protein